MPEDTLLKLGYTKPIYSRYSVPYQTDIFISKSKFDDRTHEFIIDPNDFLFPDKTCYRKVGELYYEY